MIENIFFNAIFWDPAREMFSFDIPLLGRPILWYGFFFALGFLTAYWALIYLLRRFFLGFSGVSKQLAKSNSSMIAEKMTVFIVSGAIIGARLFDVFFYQSWSVYSQDPLSIFKVWEGGLASHGGAAGILLALYFLSRKLKEDYPQFSWRTLLDLLVIPAALAGGFIRIGNFFNQEILGSFTHVPWAIIFGHPADGGDIVPRHPAQLYESIFYFGSFAFLMYLRRCKFEWFQPGKISGLFLILIFSFRFVVEFFKVEQSPLIGPHSLLDMGQFLSIPLIVLGILLFFNKLPAMDKVKGN